MIKLVFLEAMLKNIKNKFFNFKHYHGIIKEKRKALEYISIPLEINIKEIGLEINLMEKVFYYQ